MAVGVSPSRACRRQRASRLFGSEQKTRDSVSSVVQNREPDHWFMIPARLESQQGRNRAITPWVCRNIPARRLSGAHTGLERCELTKGPRAADLKFLKRKRQARPGTSNRRHWNPGFTSALCFPKFVQGALRRITS